MTEPLLVDLNTTLTQSSGEELRADPASHSWSFVSRPAPRRAPLFVPRGQGYYWTHEWQDGEGEADEELRRGEARSFHSVEDALRWLDEPED